MKLLILVIGILIAGYFIWQKIELTKFCVTNYEIKTDKVQNSMKAVLIADLHAHVYGAKNEKLISAVTGLKPDVILIPGDMIVGKYVEDYHISLEFLQEMVKIAPVYFSNGNHESRPTLEERPYSGDFRKYQSEVEALGVHILNNEVQCLELNQNKIMISGLEIPLNCYEKGHKTSLPEGFVTKKIGANQDEVFSILLAHNPAYAQVYQAWGADLTVCGHTHGGLIRIPGIGSVFSPQFEFFPKYDAGHFEKDGKHVVISKGLGTHTFHIRIFDRAEVVLLNIYKNNNV